MSLIKEVEEDRLSIYQKNKQLEEELLKLNQLKETISRLSLQNTTLTQENAKLNEEIQNLRHKKKEFSSELENMKEQNRLLLFNSQRDQDNLKNYEIQNKGLKDENARLNLNLKERQSIYEEQLMLKQENIKKTQKEVEEWQEKCEDFKKKIDVLRHYHKENQENVPIAGNIKEEKTEMKKTFKEFEELKKKFKEEMIKSYELSSEFENE